MTAPERIWAVYGRVYERPPEIPGMLWAKGYISAEPQALAAAPEVKALIDAAVKAERERCARIVDPPFMCRKGNVGLWRKRLIALAAAIRKGELK